MIKTVEGQILIALIDAPSKERLRKGESITITVKDWVTMDSNNWQEAVNNLKGQGKGILLLPTWETGDIL